MNETYMDYILMVYLYLFFTKGARRTVVRSSYGLLAQGTAGTPCPPTLQFV